VAVWFWQVILAVLMAIFGGVGQLYGPVIGAAILTYLEEFLVTRFAELYLIIFGIILVFAILYLPNGLVGLMPRLAQKLRQGGRAEKPAET
jgi:branched-chain amino acid transport system permease protein